MSIFLIGYRGSGKSTVGAHLADRLWQPFVDTDDVIVRRAGKSIREIFAHEGEPAFRDLESQAIVEACQGPPAVISLGGGALDRPQNLDVIRAGAHKVIYLRCEPAELLRRIQADPASDNHRPHLTAHGGGIVEIETVLARREPIYRAAMTAELDVTHLTPQEAVVYIARLV